MLALLKKLLHKVSYPEARDAIWQCPRSVLFLLFTDPAALIDLAHTKLHTYHYKSVPACWRRLYTDASITLAVNVIRKHLEDPKSNAAKQSIKEEKGMEDDEWMDRVVRVLDMAIIMAGAEGRQKDIETLIAALQDYVENHQLLQTKPRKFEDTYPVKLGIDDTIPVVRYPIERISNQPMDVFEKSNLNNLLKGPTPVVFMDALTYWPAFHERPWSSPAYLMERTFGGRRLIPVELGKSYTDDGWGQSIVTFKEFMQKYLLGEKIKGKIKVEDEGGDEGGDEGEDEGSNKIGYLAQHDLFSQIPALRNDTAVPIYCYTVPSRLRPGPQEPILEQPLLNAWFGPAGTVSPLHNDPYHNILCQVVGKKYIRLYSPEDSRKLYPRGIEIGGVNMSNTSRVSVEGPPDELKEKFPRFFEALYLETILSEGESLYIPAGWWHYVRSLTVSFSVSFWWN